LEKGEGERGDWRRETQQHFPYSNPSKIEDLTELRRTGGEIEIGGSNIIASRALKDSDLPTGDRVTKTGKEKNRTCLRNISLHISYGGGGKDTGGGLGALESRSIF